MFTLFRDNTRNIGFEEAIFNSNSDENIYSFITKVKSSIPKLLSNIISRKVNVMIIAYKIIIRPHFEYFCQVWVSKYHHGNWMVILDAERRQWKFTKNIKEVRNMNNGKSLGKSGITTWQERKMGGNLVETFRNFKRAYQNFFNLSKRTKDLIANPNKNGNVIYWDSSGTY